MNDTINTGKGHAQQLRHLIKDRVYDNEDLDYDEREKLYNLLNGQPGLTLDQQFDRAVQVRDLLGEFPGPSGGEGDDSAYDLACQLVDLIEARRAEAQAEEAKPPTAESLVERATKAIDTALAAANKITAQAEKMTDLAAALVVVANDLHEFVNKVEGDANEQEAKDILAELSAETGLPLTQ